jgi:hypothetical protein
VFGCGTWAYAAFVGGERSDDEDTSGLASLSFKAAVRDFFFLWRRRRSTNIPINARAATPPTTTPAIRPVDGPEAESESDTAAAAVFDDVVSSDTVLEAAFAVDDACVVVGPVLLAVLLASSVALVAVISAAMLVGFAGVGRAFTTLPATLSMIAVGTVTPLLDSTEETSPTILDRRSPICLR